MQIGTVSFGWETEHGKVNQNAWLNQAVMQSTKFEYKTNSIQPWLKPISNFDHWFLVQRFFRCWFENCSSKTKLCNAFSETLKLFHSLNSIWMLVVCTARERLCALFSVLLTSSYHWRPTYNLLWTMNVVHVAPNG